MHLAWMEMQSPGFLIDKKAYWMFFTIFFLMQSTDFVLGTYMTTSRRNIQGPS
ncbi:uncharacterized protein M6B38_101375 [Iris pallida]|uniref:Uncharacterized protein n=2 Tax=Iris pallida TaxID=29817 RepID=A0AAX6GRQ5_IRIPA|nr:uncharacterized protein M6B38_351900 [Iris pallida]KAJ6852952.1 uncharacterized protein M6B38_252360 [Iris pallida]KAJ6854129.1 uncharacterized protein M6B38_101375 [Iris pallida]